ncbi:pilus assembly protein [Moritella viscosa]|uniref:pilus assembly protein n=1 Tax=Moritella viscosa TaxID=80854 RepID=UPI00094DA4F2|nr:PilC/PilY family type IV pilus protein [Moritella viscosa]
MKRIFKRINLLLSGFILSVSNATADEGELYSADINTKPQVLIILDTSRHMKKTTTYPFPERYDPHINYLDPPPGLLANKLYDAFTSQWFYYKNSAAEIGKLASHSELVKIAEKDYLELSEQNSYNKFIATIPDYNDSDAYLKFRYMNCQSALKDFYGDLGAYSDNVRQWQRTGLTGSKYSWWSIGTETRVWPYYFVDCEADIANRIARNPGHEYEALFSNEDDNGDLQNVSRQGFPDLDSERWRWNSYAGEVVRNFEDRDDDNTYLYSQNLVKWAQLKATGTTELNISYLNLAKKVVLDLMLKTPEIQSGLEIFNMNNTNLEWIDIQNNHGGRIVSGIKSLDPLDFDSDMDYQNAVSRLRNTVGDILTTSDSRSALCESLYEGYRYLYGEEVEFGDSQHLLSRPERDKSIEVSGKYRPGVSFNACQEKAYIIVISAGYHDFNTYFSCNNHDGEANDEIAQLARKLGLTDVEINEKQVNSYVDRWLYPDCEYKNSMPVLSHYLYNNDLNTTTIDKQERIATYTIGLGPLSTGSSELLEKTAIEGGGKFYNPIDAKSLQQTLQMAFADMIASQTATTSSISTSISSSNSTQSDNTVYYSMFEPNQTSRWRGNLKKFTIEDGKLSSWTEAASTGNNTDFTAALSSETGTFFKKGSYSGWSSEDVADPNDVVKGGVNAAYPNRKYQIDADDSGDINVHNPRHIFITNDNNNDGNDDELLPLSKDNLFTALGYPLTSSSSSDDISVAEVAVASLLGIGVEGIDDSIQWLQGLNSSGTKYREDIFGDPMHSVPLVIRFQDQVEPRIFIGTNAGFFHAFKDSGRNVEEEWAFIPTNMIRRALALRGVTNARQRIYGIDGSPVDVKYTDSSGSYKHLIAFGLRRGGSSYYGLNVNITAGATTPTLAWEISNDSSQGDGAKFAELGQTWSTPVVGKVYQGLSQSGDPLAENEEPVLIFGAGYDTDKDDCVSNTKPCMDDVGRGVYLVNALSGERIHNFTDTSMFEDSIASKLTIFDSNGDGYIDRIYVPDTGGNIYRIDLPFTYDNKTEVKSRWTAMKLAELGSFVTSTDDRRFFNPPAIVRGRNSDGTAYDGVLIGSGDITQPNSDDITTNYFFNIKDDVTNATIWKGDYSGSSETNVRITPEPKKLSDLTNTVNGWKYELPAGGEKSLGAGVVIDGVVHFNSYTPFADTLDPIELENGQCVLNKTGDSSYYQMDLNTGSKITSRKLLNTIAKDLAVHAGVNRHGVSVLRILGAGKGDSTTVDGAPTLTGLIDTAVTLTPKWTYRYFNEAAQ